MIVMAWIISFLLWPPWIFAWPYIEGQRTVPEDHCYIQFLETNVYITFGTAIAAFYLPVSVMCALYWRIWLETEKRKKDLGRLQGDRKQSVLKRKSTSSVNTLDSEDLRSSESDKCQSQLTSTLSLATSKSSLPETSKTQQLRDFLVSLLHVGNGKQHDDRKSHRSSHGTLTPPTAETSVESVSTELVVEFNPSGHPRSGEDSSAVTLPTSDHGEPPRDGKPEEQQTSQSTDSVYTIPVQPVTTPSPNEESQQACAEAVAEKDTEQPELVDGMKSSDEPVAPDDGAAAKQPADPRCGIRLEDR
ncbi:hypothetical protein MTO96_011224 [Rhipicephalus appendiculatus]